MRLRVAMISPDEVGRLGRRRKQQHEARWGSATMHRQVALGYRTAERSHQGSDVVTGAASKATMRLNRFRQPPGQVAPGQIFFSLSPRLPSGQPR